MSVKSSAADADQLAGTYKLISATRTDLETGQAMVENLTGFITCAPEGRMMALIVA